ncbi:hypothetical protein NLG97_g3823 [Lecanicillium saksenae]|uniref:Uncharacterized protein n=1 Tax=Lecanicillium saksenae TaxID=468837 RepID=A0ACC1QZP0_9HYPO|nr:hypothetical protein NLG97_g3823 [Lecanicillium saksenae]
MFNNSHDTGQFSTTDTVVPLGIFDEATLKRLTLIYTTFHFPGVLDAAKLRNSLELLIEKDGWNKLGARLRRNKKTGSLEHHIPVQFTRDRPAVRFHHARHDMAIKNHHVASKFPTRTPEPAVMVDPNELQSLWQGPNSPTELRHYLERDEPQLGVFVASFNDATVISLSWPHSLFDAIGFGELLFAWSLMIQDRPNEIAKPLDAQLAPLAGLGLHSKEPHKLQESQLSWLSIVIFFCQTLIQVIFYKQKSRMLYVPGKVVQALHENANRELAGSGVGQGTTNQYLTEGDVLSAWWAKVNVAHHSEHPHKVVHLANALGWRPSLANGVLPSGRPYLSNAVGIASVLLPARDVLASPLSHVAWEVRQSITEARRPEQVEAYAALWRRSPARLPPLFGDSTMHMVTCSNWSRADLFRLDFSAALADHDTAASPTELGRPSYVQSCFRGVYLSNVMVIVGKDAHGGYWLTAFTSAKHWARIEQAISKI